MPKLWYRTLLLLALLTFAGFALPVNAQDTDDSAAEVDDETAAEPETTATGFVTITSSDISALPSIQLEYYAREADGRPIDTNSEPVAIRHAGTLLPDERVSVVGARDIGTFTIFLIDLPGGVEGNVSTIDSVIRSYAQETTLKGQVDAAAVYLVAGVAAEQLVGPVSSGAELINALNRTPLETRVAATALVDSIGRLITDIDTLRPDPEMPTSIVVFSDGTDAVSTEFAPDAIGDLAAERDVRLHTVWVDNVNLTFGKEIGQAYLAEISAASDGSALFLTDQEGIDSLWLDIASYRSRTLVAYTLENLIPGPADVELTLPDRPALGSATTRVEVPDNVPTIVIDVPAEEAVISLPTLDRPVNLRFPTTVTWLDGIQRSVSEAQLIVNGLPLVTLDPAELDYFTTTINTLFYGQNEIRVAILDDQGIAVQSPPLMLTVTQDRRQIPTMLRPGGLFGTLATWGGILLLAVALIVLGVAGVRRANADRGNERQRQTRRPPRRTAGDQRGGRLANVFSRSARARPEPDTSPGMTPPPAAPIAAPARRTAPAPGTPTLEILSAQTPMPESIDIRRSEFLIGRSPTVDLAFVNDSTVSRIHASIVHDPGTNVYRIYDEQSTSGTYLNEQLVPEYGLPLSDGDEIHLGAVALRFRLASPRR